MTTPSIRQPGATPRGGRPADDRFVYADPRFAPDPRVAPEPRLATPTARPAARPAAPAAPARRRPDPAPMRLMMGVLGLASAAAITTAMLPSIAPADAADTSAAVDPNAVDPNAVDPNAVDPNAGAVAPEPSVRHVTRYVTLAPGQTAPPQSTVVVRPKPTPKVTVKVVTRTRQSGKP